MLIHLDSSGVADCAPGSPTQARSRAAIENLLLAHFEGSHAISLSPPDAELLCAASPPWSERAVRALDHIEESYSQIAGLRAEVPLALELGIGADFDSREHAVSGGQKVVRAPLHSFERVQATLAAALLGENGTDADLFRELGLLRRAERQWEGVSMVHQARGTGGSTFAPECVRVAETGQILLALADSDLSHPKGGAGGTYHKLRASMAGRPAYQGVRAVPARTAEGLIPLAVYNQAFRSLHKGQDQRLQVVERIEVFLRSAPADIARYANFKAGIRLHQVENPDSEDEGSYWSEIARKARRHQCTRPSTEQCKAKKDCQCYVVDALGEKALADVVAWMRTKRSKRALLPFFDLSSKPELRELSDTVLAWGLALSPLLT